MTGPWQVRDSAPSMRGRRRHAVAMLPVAALALAATVLAGCPASPADPQAARKAAAVDEGVRLAQACEGEVDADLAPYTACIEAQLRAAGDDAARRAGLRFQAWIMADLATQHSAAGATDARLRWWRALQADLSAARLTVEELCAQRGLDVGEIRGRAARLAAAG